MKIVYLINGLLESYLMVKMLFLKRLYNKLSITNNNIIVYINFKLTMIKLTRFFNFIFEYNATDMIFKL